MNKAVRKLDSTIEVILMEDVMNFTNKEVELARDMKANGLEWKPEVGDWFTSSHPDATPFFLCTKMDSPWLVHTHGEGHIDASVWLPLWHQGRGILDDNKIAMILATYTNEVTLKCYRLESDPFSLTYIGVVAGKTDLDVMYQVILMYVLGAPRIADCTKASNGTLSCAN